MITQSRSIEKAIQEFDRESQREAVERAEEQRRQMLERFPIEHWPEMRLEEYALGQEDSENTFCRWMEFRTPDLGSIRGGSSRKMIIYKHRDEPGWFYPRIAQNEQAAWQQLRSEFVQAFEFARKGEWAEIDALELLGWGPALRVKTLHLYFPDEVLPVYSNAHLKFFLGLLGRAEEVRGYNVVQTNRNLLAALRSVADLQDWSTVELMRFLYYGWAHPNDARRAVKIAPGRGGQYWEDCLREGYICVGWDGVGDLSQYESKEAFREKFAEAHPYDGHQPTVSRKSNELWTLRELEPGDVVVANQGVSKILGVGEVVEPGYQWREDRPDHKHTVAVKWDASYEQTLDAAENSWATVTVKKVPPDLLETILASGGTSGDSKPTVPADTLYFQIESSLKRKGQVILYGPPGTGKTYAARRFSVWWLLRKMGESEAESVLGSSARIQHWEQRLAAPGDGGVGQLTRVTFHPSYAYEDFIEGFRPSQQDSGALALRLEDGLFKRICRAAAADPDRPYLLLIDEINRGNVAKILGELLTLLERDKRGLTVLLPQSKEPFSIPPNVYLLGAMNTADRSIKLLDAALRRRFAFIELMPNIELLGGASVGGLAVDGFLEELNQRIARYEGREKQIGHSYLLDGGSPMSDVEEFACCFREEILPLLQEYCYDEYGTLARFIGDALVDSQAQSLNREVVEDPERLLAALIAEFGEATPETGE